MKFILKRGEPYAEAKRLIGAGGGEITDLDVLDWVLLLVDGMSPSQLGFGGKSNVKFVRESDGQEFSAELLSTIRRERGLDPR